MFRNDPSISRFRFDPYQQEADGTGKIIVLSPRGSYPQHSLLGNNHTKQRHTASWDAHSDDHSLSSNSMMTTVVAPSQYSTNTTITTATTSTTAGGDSPRSEPSSSISSGGCIPPCCSCGRASCCRLSLRDDASSSSVSGATTTTTGGSAAPLVPPPAVDEELDSLNAHSQHHHHQQQQQDRMVPHQQTNYSYHNGNNNQHLAIPYPFPHHQMTSEQQPILGYTFPVGGGAQTARIHVSNAYYWQVLAMNRCGFLNDSGNKTHEAENAIAKAALNAYSVYACVHSKSRSGKHCPNHAWTFEPLRNAPAALSLPPQQQDYYREGQARQMTFEEFLVSEPALAGVQRRHDFVANQTDDLDHAPFRSYHGASFLAVYDRVFGLKKELGGAGGIVTHYHFEGDSRSLPDSLNSKFLVPEVAPSEVGALLQGGTRGASLFVGQIDPAKFRATISLVNQTLALSGLGEDYSALY